MSGKAYTMKEMKVIVEYVAGRKAYGEVKGRKMWVDFANTELTVRSWQSLKETFLKRILPDIHNPYYKLSLEQIRSFREGCDVTEKEQNKLQIINIDDNPVSTSNVEDPDTQPSTSHANNGNTTTGEEVTCSKVQSHDRDSVDTVIIPTCYETAEDVQRALESPKTTKDADIEHTKNTTPPSKSLRDLITYSEPLTPMLQEVLHDFATDEDSDSGEIRMQIVEAIPNSEPTLINDDSPILVHDSESQTVNEQPPIEILDSEDFVDKDNNMQEELPDNAADFVQPKVLSLKLKKRKGGYKIDKKKNSEKGSKRKSDENNSNESELPALNKPTEGISEISNTDEKAVNEKQDPTVVAIPEKSNSNLSNSTDTLLPNNQEALDNSNKTTNTNSKEQVESQKSIGQDVNTINKNTGKSQTRKRACSQDISTESKKNKNLLDVKMKVKEKAVSDTDTIRKKLKSPKTANVKADFINKTGQVKQPNSKSDERINDPSRDPKSPTENEPSSSIMTSNTTDLSQLNPCLKSVSLFAEQFNQVSYIDSESEPEVGTSGVKNEGPKKKNKEIKKADKNKKETEEDKNKAGGKVLNTVDEVVMLKSHSESESENEFSPKKNAPMSRASKLQRDKVLSNVFGFSSGAVGTKRRRVMSHRKNSTYRYPRKSSSAESSEWTSESDGSEAYVSPPRGRKNRHTRKYLKPHSARILSLEEEGGLFVMYGKKIYPLVKDGKIVKNYLTYLPESDPEEEESYWKLKYVEERKRVEELRKLVDRKQTEVVKEKSPILPAKSLRNMADYRSPGVKNKLYDPDTIPIPVPLKENNEETNDTGKTLKITFAKNNQEVHVEGHWSNIHPVLAEVVQIFNKDAEPSKECLPIGNVEFPIELSETSSDKSVPIVPIVDKAVHEKIDKLETEIFKEIEKRHQEEEVDTKESSETNVTKRKRASRSIRSLSNQSSVVQKSSTSSTRSPKRQKASDTNEKEADEQETSKPEKKIEEKSSKSKPKSGKRVPKTETKVAGKNPSSKQKAVDKTAEPDEKQEITKETSKENQSIEGASNKSSVKTRRQTRTPKKEDKEPVTPKSNTKSTRKSKVASPAPIDDDDEVRYMFPPAKKPAKTPKSALSLNKTRENKRYMTDTPKIYSSPNLSLVSESTQGYQDSDISPPKAVIRRKRKLSLNTALSKIRYRSIRNTRKSCPIITDDVSSDSNSSYHIVVRPVTDNTSLKSDVYKSDSYQLLFPQNKSIFKPLQKIDEDGPAVNEKLLEKSLKASSILNAHKITLDINMNSELVSSSNVNTDGGNSSNVSLPLSPELSIVENLSISKELLNSVRSHSNLNDIEASRTVRNEIHNKYMMSHIDVSMPLMEQNCDFCPTLHIKTEHSFDELKPPAISDSLVNKINTVNIEDAPSLSESLDTRLRNLLLDSAKKMSMRSNEENNIEAPEDIKKKTMSGKRCSTPRKRREIQKKKLKITDPVVEEECTETCSFGRNSCPPAIQLITAENVVCKENVDMNIANDAKVNDKSKSRKKKDVIKVKILRPRSRVRKEDPPSKRVDMSVHNDSGINESQSVISNIGFDETVELIHNHSETCLHANECLADSVECVETTTRSIISVNTDSMSATDGSFSKDQIIFKDCEELVAELFCHNAQGRIGVNTVREHSKVDTDTGETVFHSPVFSDSSLITDDLSDENPQSQATKWYLLSEDETQTNSNITGMNPPSLSFGSSLKQIFPITCAVPNLSTITEMSNENSRKLILEADNTTRFDFDSESLFDTMN